MPMKLSAIQPMQEPRELTLDFGEAGTIEMTVLPDKFNLGHQRAIKKAQRDNDLPAMADILFSAIDEWDLEDEDGEVIPLDLAPLLIGRGNDAAIRLDDDYVSTRHARIASNQDQWYVEDLGSTNGTYVGSTRITTPTTLTLGSQVRIGKTIMELRK